MCISTRFAKMAKYRRQAVIQGTRKHKLSHAAYFQLQSGMVLFPS